MSSSATKHLDHTCLNILFISLNSFEDTNVQGIYTDLLKVFVAHGHRVFAMGARQRRSGLPTELVEEGGISVLRIATGNITKTNMLEKGISTLRLRKQFLSAFNDYFGEQSFDLIIYTTPPTTVANLVNAVKKKTGAKAYLLLKDIFPQDALDVGLLATKGLKGIVYRYFKKTETETYRVADWIGCMSAANVDYLLSHEPWIDSNKVEVNPNSLTPKEPKVVDRAELVQRYGLPETDRLFIYGGNLGAFQGIDFLVEVLRLNELSPAAFFLIAGAGVDRHKLETFFENNNPTYCKLLPFMPRDEFDDLLSISNAGLILLRNDFTIPNFPSRLLSYMQAGLPIITATDSVCDVGRIAEANGFGTDARSDDAAAFLDTCRKLTDADLTEMGKKAHDYFLENYTAERTYELIMRRMNE